MIPPKTNWTADDYFNLVDCQRIVGNLRELCEERGVDCEKLVWNLSGSDYDSALSQAGRDAVVDTCIRLAASAEWKFPLPNDHTPRWFNAQELNIIEGLCADIAAPELKAAYGQGRRHGDGLHYGGGVVG